MPWPGAPKSQQSPTINPPSVRYTYPLNENSTTKDVTEALRVVFNGLTNHEQAFANLPSQITTQATAAATAAVQNTSSETTAGVTSFNASVGSVIFFPSLGTVNNQLGNSAYTTQATDNGAKIIVGDSSAVSVTLNSGVAPPWFTFIVNDSSASVTLLPDSGATYRGSGGNVLYPGGFAVIFYDGNTFWA